VRVAILSDIHGNLVALEAVLTDLALEPPDQMICLGDVAATGPEPQATIDRLEHTGCRVVMGNTDAWLLDPQPEAGNDEDARRIEAIDFWCAAQLSRANREYLATFQPTVEVELGDDTTLLCFHGSPTSNTDVLLATPPEEELDRLFAGRRAAVMAGGHTHQPMIRRHRGMLIVNPGSVGLPFERGPAAGQVRNPPWAEYALIRWNSGQLGVELRRVPIDSEAVIERALASGMPHAEWWAEGWR
jgi:putative phosphoesterase